MTQINRLRWRCRRGLLELDIVLGRFLDTQYGTLTGAERDAFQRLLTSEDAVLWGLITQSPRACEGESERVLALLREC